MTRRANPMAVKAALTYEVGEAAAALHKSPATIRNWIKDGLQVMASRKPNLISGAAIREYLQEKHKTAKCPLEPDELYCLSCRAGRRPLGMVVEAVANSSKTTRLNGVCDRCSAHASRIDSDSKIQSFARTFHFKESGSSEA